MTSPRLRHSAALLLGVLLLGGCGRGPSLANRANGGATHPDGGASTAATSAGSEAGSQVGSQAGNPASARPPLDHSRYARVLERFVDRDGLVDYEALQQQPGDLKAYVAALGAVAPERFAGWSASEQIAFLLNAYNALTLASIIAEEPIRPSIRDILGVWNLRRHTVAGEAMTLDHIEHGILRKRYDEPRIHAALVCAAISCPPLRQEPYSGQRLNAQLDDQTRRWLGSPQGLVIDRGTGTVAVSAIFQWFGDDWKRRYGTREGFGRHERERPVLNFISDYVNADARAYLRRGDYTVTHLNYDWSLNRQ